MRDRRQTNTSHLPGGNVQTQRRRMGRRLKRSCREDTNLHSAKSVLYRARRKQTPKLPTTTADIQLDGKWTQTTTGERFLLFDDTQGPRIIAFASTDNLTNLAASDRIYCDGTFYTCPTIFHQIYTIHVQLDGVMYPVVYALLPGKSQQIYQRLFSLLKTDMTDINLQLTPTTVFMDFETAAQNAIRSVIPNIQVNLTIELKFVTS